MSSDSPLPRPDRAHSYYYDDGGRLSEARDVAGNDEFIVATYVYSCVHYHHVRRGRPRNEFDRS
jgi:hypothetical protein